MGETPQGAPSEEELIAMEFDGLPELYSAILDWGIDTNEVGMSNAMTDGILVFNTGRILINTPPDPVTGNVRFTQEGAKELKRKVMRFEA